MSVKVHSLSGLKNRASIWGNAAAQAVLLVLFATSSSVFALTPGPTIIRQCPSCTNALRQFTIGSGNTVGAKYWTDGFMRAPMLPLLPNLVKCPHCKGLLWLDEAKELARIKIGDKGEQWKNAKELLDPEEADYLEAAQAAKVSRTHELEARRRAWWLANDPAREAPSKKIAWTGARRQNLVRLSALLDDRKDDELVWKAEIARELGEFDRCLELLRRPVGKNWAETAKLVARLATEKQTQVERLP